MARMVPFPLPADSSAERRLYAGSLERPVVILAELGDEPWRIWTGGCTWAGPERGTT